MKIYMAIAPIALQLGFSTCCLDSYILIDWLLFEAYTGESIFLNLLGRI